MLHARLSFARRLVVIAALSLLAIVPACAEPAMWVVKGPHASVYLFGTVHVLPAGRAWRSLKIDRAMQSSSALWLEVANPDDTAAMEGLVRRFGVDPQHPLSTKLSRAELTQLDAVARQAGMAGEAAMEPMRPWMAALTLSMAPVIQAGYNPQSGAELVIRPEFVKAGKPIHAFETLNQQIHLFADLPQRDEVDYLNVEVRDFAHGTQQLNDMITAWFAGDEAGLDKSLEGGFRKDYPMLYRRILVQRNLNWMPMLKDLAQGDQTVFVAVGAGHMVGPDGLVELLRKAGYQVDRL